MTELKFAELYRTNKQDVQDTLTAMWCGDGRNELQKNYAEQIKSLIDSKLFASESFMPLVQCMDPYESISQENVQEADALVGNLWSKINPKYPPYKHQYEAWKVLSDTEGPKKSMVVTTGTGSGKTECFMLPLVSDLIKRKKEGCGGVQAIFLYPLNALMEDQKKRLQALLKGTELKFAVYNGNLPDDDKDGCDKIVESEHDAYPNILATRSEMYSIIPDIMLTNPTMLEYMLLRNKDQKFFECPSLKWVVIDEAHSYNGAGAAELAMLLRRVLDAFGVEAGKDVRFATSSATIGNATTEEKKEENKRDLRKFISDLSGVPVEQVVPIDGKRVEQTANVANDPYLQQCRNKLLDNDYVKLDELISEGDTIEDKLERLDELCGQRDADGNPLMKAKVHYFYRVLTNGLRVQLSDIDPNNPGMFAVKDEVKLEDPTPYLELMRCNLCGNYFAVGESDDDQKRTYKELSGSDSDLFVFDEDINAKKSKYFFGLKKAGVCEVKMGDETKIGNCYVCVDKNTISHSGEGNLVMNVKGRCPYCGEQLIEKDKKDAGQDEDSEEKDLEEKKVRKFRLSSALVSRVLAPGTLSSLPEYEKDSAPHRGQQYISFVDSRQTAARATFQQNKETERSWVYSRLFDKLSKNKLEAEKNRKSSDQFKPFKKEVENLSDDFKSFLKEKLNENPKVDYHNYLSWDEIFETLRDDPDCDKMCRLFLKKERKGNDPEIEEDGTVDVFTKAQYVYSIMIDLLGKRPRAATAPETMGLFTSCYPDLDKITELPDDVQQFNEKIPGDTEITVAEWRNFLKIFLDVQRSNQSVFINKKIDGHNLDTETCRRFARNHYVRRPIQKPQVNENSPSDSVLFLAKLIAKNNEDLKTVVNQNKALINLVLDDMWKALKDNNLIEVGKHLKKKSNNLEDDELKKDNEGNSISDTNYRLNVEKIAFKLYDKACLCDVATRKDQKELRPIETLFMGYNPYVKTRSQEVKRPEVDYEEWPVFDRSKYQTKQEVAEWAQNNRKHLWNYGLWGDYGCFSNRLYDAYLYPEVFLQLEDTAQVDKKVAQQNREEFKKHQINIMACSTTMEMGVDMGDLDLVMMTSVPPHPSNYKQRAGRSGRNNSSRSVCITLCGSDAVGLRTLYSPMEQLIHRPMAVPAVDLNSPQVIRRHVNAFLLRKSGVLFGKESNLNQMVIDFFTPFSFQKDVQFNNRPNYAQVEYKDDDDNVQMISAKSYNYQISERLSECPSLMCDQFVDYLNKLGEHQEDLKELSNLLKQTCLEVEKGCEMCKKDTERIKDEFIDSLDSIQNAYKDNEEDLNRGKEKKEKREKALKYKFSELLATPLISYFATHRFTPNANMPVNIISFDLSNMGKKDSNYWKYRYKNIGNNPSYPIQTALSQYAPGNTVVMDNKSVKVAGVDCANIYNPTKTYKTIYTDGSQTVVDFKEGLKGTPKNWSVNNKEGLTLIEPISFLPAADSEYTREEPQNRYTQVSAQLIGAGNWQVQNEKGLLAMRCNRDSGDAKILYYNEGIGFGYAFCTNCGKSVLETGIERKPSCCPGINDEEKNKGFYHYDITSSLKCEKGTIKRNVIFGGLIQTDYCEIKIKKEKNGSWITSKKDSDNLLTTLGVLFTQVFAEYIGINRGEIDFTITPNGHLCVFDTNPGGAGYSNQLADRLMMNDVLKNSLALLSGGENTAGRMVNPVKTKDELLDKITIRYLDKLDVEAAKTWMERESEDDDNDLKSVQHSYSNAQKVYLQDIYKAFRSEQNVEKMLFVNDDYDKWLYDPDSQDELGWRSRVDTIKQSAGDVKVCVCVCTQLPVPFKVYPWLRKMSDWSSVQKGIPEIKGDFYPLAKCGSRFFFTDCKDSAALNGHWGNSNIYCTDLKCRIEAKPINVNDEDKNRHFVIGREQSTTSRDLAGLVASKIGNDLLKRFGEHCKSSEKVKITYQDQHLKSVLGIVTTLQFIDYFIERFGIKSFDLNFENETYKDDSNRNRVDVNLIDSLERDEKLRKLTDIWLDNKSKQNVRGTMNILPQTSKKLPHWRELKFECGDCSLSLFPNGGIINEWFLDNKSNKCSKFYKNDNTTTEDAVPLHNRTEVMYDVILTEK